MNNTKQIPVLVHQSTITGAVKVFPASNDDELDDSAQLVIQEMWYSNELPWKVSPKPGESRADHLARVETFENVKSVINRCGAQVVVSERGSDETDIAWNARTALARHSNLIITETRIMRELNYSDFIATLPQWEKTVTKQYLTVQDLGL